MDRHGNILGRVERMILTGRHPARIGSIRGLAEVKPPLKRCPNCYWLRIHHVGVLRIRALRFDPAPRRSSIFHFKVVSMPMHHAPLIAAD